MDWIHNGVVFKESMIPDGAVGFIYEMSAIIDGKSVAYIGKKNFFANIKRPLGKKALALTKDKRLKKYTREIKPAFMKYYSSNKILKEAYKAGVVIKREILMICYSATELTYQECKYLFCNDCIIDDKYLNSNILGKFYRGSSYEKKS
jgi:hypothetical protein